MPRILTSEEEMGLCREFLRLTSSGAGREHWSPVLEQLLPSILSWARGCVLRQGVKVEASITPDDAVQMVAEKLLKSPPTKPPGENPRVQLKAWVKQVTFRTLIDLNRRRSYKGAGGERQLRQGRSLDDPEPQRAAREITSTVDERLEARQTVAALLEYLDENYPRGAEYLRARATHDDASGNELAAVLGVSRANFDKIASRTRQYAVRFLESQPSMESEGRGLDR